MNVRDDQPRPGRWEEIDRRLDAIRAAIEQDASTSPEEQKAILRGRAQELAREPAAGEEQDDRLHVLVFTLGQERYGVEAQHVREVCPLRSFTPLPCVPAFIAGIMNVRGEIVSVFDLRRFLDPSAEAWQPSPGTGAERAGNDVVIIRSPRMQCGILADAVAGIRQVSAVELQPPPPALSERQQRYLHGVTQERLAVLDILELLSDEALIVDEEVT